jgi:hypothetical protein
MRLKGKDCEIRVNGREPDLSLLSSRQRKALSDPEALRAFVRETACRQGPARADVVCRSGPNLPARLVDPEADLCAVGYRPFQPNAWITREPGPRDPEFRRWLLGRPGGRG